MFRVEYLYLRMKDLNYFWSPINPIARENIDEKNELISGTGSVQDSVMRNEKPHNNSSDDGVPLSEFQRSLSKYYYNKNLQVG